MSDPEQPGTEQEPSRYVTVFHQLKETEDGERGDRLVVHAEHLDDRYIMDDDLEDFVPVARPIAVIDAGVEMEHDELGEWCNSHAGKAILNEFFPDIEPDDPTLRDVEEYLDDEPEIVTDGGLRTPTHCPHCGYDGAFDGHGRFTRQISHSTLEGDGHVETHESWDKIRCPDCGNKFALLNKTVRIEHDEDGNEVDKPHELVTDGGVDQPGVDHRELRREARELRQVAIHKVAVALALEDGELTQHEAEQYLELDDEFAMVRSDYYPGDDYYDRARRCLERRGDMDV